MERQEGNKYYQFQDKQARTDQALSWRGLDLHLLSTWSVPVYCTLKKEFGWASSQTDVSIKFSTFDTIFEIWLLKTWPSATSFTVENSEWLNK